MSTPSQNQPQQRHSKLIYGSNAVILAIIAAALVIALNYLFSQQTALRWRSTTNVTLSPASIKLLQELDGKTKGTYTIVNLFEAKFNTKQRTEEEQVKAENSRAVSDLLREYTRYTSHIQITTPDTRNDVESMIKERFASDETIIRAALVDLEKLFKDLEALCKVEGANFSQLAQQKDAEPEEVAAAVDLRTRFTDQIPELIRETRRAIDRETSSTLPRWNILVNLLGISFDSIDANLKKFTDIEDYFKKNPIEKDTSKAMIAIINHIFKIADSVDKQRKAIKVMGDKLAGLPTEKLAAITLPNAPCLVLFPPAEGKDAQNIKVIRRDEMFTSNNSMGTAAEIFDGESPLSTQILPMVRPDKVHVVFVASNRNFIQNFGEVAERLEKNNFSVDIWAPFDPRDMQQGMPPPTDMKPKYAGKGVVWVVFTNERNFTPQGQPDQLTDEVTRHMDAGGAVMFLASPTATSMSVPDKQPGTTQPAASEPQFIFNSLIAKYGIQVNSNQVVVSTFPLTDARGVTKKITSGLVTVTEYSNDVITDPIQTLVSGFGIPGPRNSVYDKAFMTNIVHAVKTNGATSSEFLFVPPSNDTFYPGKGFVPGENWVSEKREIRVDDDPATSKVAIKGPYPIGAKGSIGSGADERRVLVIGNVSFAHTVLIQAGMPVERAGTLLYVAVLPGNSEVFVNSIMWLAKDENRIAISVNASSASRIKISPAAKKTIEWSLLYTGLPLLALLAGAIVWRARRR